MQATKDANRAATATVLVADPHEAERRRLVAFLTPFYGVATAATIEEGLAVCRGRVVDCVLLDVSLGAGDLRAALARFAKLRLPVISIAGRGSRELSLDMTRVGVRDHLDKTQINAYALDRVIRRELERYRLETDLRAMQERFEEVASRIDEVLWVRDLEGRFLYLSQAFERIWQRARGGMTVAAWEAAMHPDDVARRRSLDSGALRGRECAIDYRVVRPNGEVRHIRDRAYPIIDEDGTVIRIGGIARDVTEENRLQEELRLAQKLEAIGQLAAGIAHEINTPTQYLSDSLTFFEEAFEGVRPLLERLDERFRERRTASEDEIEELAALVDSADLAYLLDEVPGALKLTSGGIAQIRKIVTAMKDFSFPGEEQEEIDLNAAITTTTTICRNEWKYHADVETELDGGLPLLRCVPAALNQVLLNIIVNAAHAVADANRELGRRRGRIGIRTRRDGEFAEVAVEDTGTGIPDEIRGRIFDPFFTTKKAGKGTGQGLAICHRIVVERHGGSIRVESRVGEGTRFVVRLPLGGVAPLEQTA